MLLPPWLSRIFWGNPADGQVLTYKSASKRAEFAAAAGGGDLVKIGTYTVGADTASYTISGIPGGSYRKLLADFIFQPPTLGAVGYKPISCYVNGDTDVNSYRMHVISAEGGSSPSSVIQVSGVKAEIGYIDDVNDATNNKGAFGHLTILQRPTVVGKPITVDSVLFWTYGAVPAYLSREVTNVTKLTDATGYVSSLTFAIGGASPPAWIKAGSEITLYGVK